MNSFFSNFIKIFSGGLVSQVIYFFTLPIITRLYSVENIGIYGALLSTVSIFSIVLTMRMELNIVEDKGKLEVAVGAALYYLLFAVVSFSPIYAFYLFFTLGESISVIFLALCSSIVVAIFQISNSIHLTLSRYNIMSFSNVTRVCVCVVIQVLIFNFFDSSVEGLLIGYCLSFLVPMLLWQRKLLIPTGPKALDIINYFKMKYSDTKYAGGQAVINAVSQAIPYVTLPLLFSSQFVGLYFIADKVFRAPLLLIGNPIRQVFLKYCCELEKPDQIHRLFKKIFIFTLLPSCLVALVLAFWGAKLFSLVFGFSYYDSGKIAAWLSLWGGGALVAFPSLSYLRVNGQNKFLFYNEMLFILIKILGVYLFFYWFNDGYLTVAVFSSLSLIMYILIIVKAYKMILKSIE